MDEIIELIEEVADEEHFLDNNEPRDMAYVDSADMYDLGLQDGRVSFARRLKEELSELEED
jgi:hypothetical protein